MTKEADMRVEDVFWFPSMRLLKCAPRWAQTVTWGTAGMVSRYGHLRGGDALPLLTVGIGSPDHAFMDMIFPDG